MKKLLLAFCFFLAFPFLTQASGTATVDILGSVYTSANSAGYVAVSGNYAYIADGENGVRVVDVSDPNNPEVVNVYDLTGVEDIKISGHYAYVAADYIGLRVLDISDPLNLELVGSYDIENNEYFREIFLSGQYAYLSLGDTGLAIVNVSDPTNPTLIGSYSNRSEIVSVHVSGNYAYAADQNNGFLVIDVSDPTNPTLVGSTAAFAGYSSYVTVDGDYAYVAEVCSGYYIVDISDPANPSVVHEEDPGDSIVHILINGHHALLVDRLEGLYTYDITDPLNPVQENLLSIGGHYLNNITISGDYGYIGHFGTGLNVINVSDITSPTLVSDIKISSDVREVKFNGDYAYALDNFGGLIAYDVSDSENMEAIGGYHLFYGTDLEISGQYAYISNTLGLYIIDISDPTNMSLTGSASISNGQQVYIEGDYAYVAGINDDEAFAIVDISDKANPSVVSTYSSENDYYGVYVEGDYAYISGYGDRLSVFDISDKANPNKVSSKTSNNPYGHDLLKIGQYLYVLDNGSIYVYNIDDPDSPKKVYSGIGLGIPVRGVLDGNYLYTTLYHNGGVAVYDVSDASNPVGIATSNTLGSMGLAINNGISYLGSDKFYAANISFVTEVEGIKNGKIKITYNDGSTEKMTVFNVSEKIKDTKVVHYQDDYYVVLQPRGKKFALVNISTQEVLNRETIAKNKKYPINTLKVMELQGTDFAVAISRKKSQVRIYIAKIVIDQEKFGKDARLLLTDAKVTPSKSTKYKSNKIKLRGSKGRLRHTLKVDYSNNQYIINEE